MSKNLFAFVTFGGLKFSKLAIESLRDTVESEYDIFAVVGKPGDWETKEWLDKVKIPHTMHTENMGFPFSVNDIYDYTWKMNKYDNLILFGNDIVFYPFAGDSLLKQAEETDYEVISALQYDVKELVNEFPETAEFFPGSNFRTGDLSSKPWEKFKGYGYIRQIADMKLCDIQNLCLYKRSAFDKVGYTDVNFYPAYFIDNDYARRLVLAGVKGCTLMNARFFHFWSRTIHEGTGGSTSKQFRNNEDYYKRKWGGVVGEEIIQDHINIPTRDEEVEIVRRWRSKR